MASKSTYFNTLSIWASQQVCHDGLPPCLQGKLGGPRASLTELPKALSYPGSRQVFSFSMCSCIMRKSGKQHDNKGCKYEGTPGINMFQTSYLKALEHSSSGMKKNQKTWAFLSIPIFQCCCLISCPRTVWLKEQNAVSSLSKKTVRVGTPDS